MAFQRVPLNFSGGAYKTVDLVTLRSGLGAELYNAYVEETGANIRFPGANAWVDTSEAAKVVGLYWWKTADVQIGVINQKVFKVTASSGTGSNISGTHSPDLGQRCYFADYGPINNVGTNALFMTNGTEPMIITDAASQIAHGGNLYTCKITHLASSATEPGVGGSWTTYWTDNGVGAGTAWVTGYAYGSGKCDSFYDLDNDMPSVVSHCYVQDGYLLLNEVGTTRMHFNPNPDPTTNPPGVFSWDGTFFSVINKPDVVEAFVGDNQEVTIIGDQSVEVWRNDGVSPWSQNEAAALTVGCIAPDSLIQYKGQTFYLSEEGHFVTIMGRQAVSVSMSMDRLISSFDTINDAQSDIILVDGRTFLVISFPAEGETLGLSLDIKAEDAWFRLGDWSGSEYGRWNKINASCYSPEWNTQYIGDATTGKVYELLGTTTTNAGEDWRFERRTESFDHNTGMRKRSRRLIFKLLRSNTDDLGGNIGILVRWRDDGSMTWGAERTLDLGKTSDTAFYEKTLWSLGSYTSRQYEVVISDPGNVILVGVEEEVEVLRS